MHTRWVVLLTCLAFCLTGRSARADEPTCCSAGTTEAEQHKTNARTLRGVGVAALVLSAVSTVAAGVLGGLGLASGLSDTGTDADKRAGDGEYHAAIGMAVTTAVTAIAGFTLLGAARGQENASQPCLRLGLAPTFTGANATGTVTTLTVRF